MKHGMKKVLIIGLMALMASCVKDTVPNDEQFKILKEKEKVTVGADWATFIGEYAYSGVVDGMKLRVGEEEHLYGSDDYEVTLNGNSFYVEVTGLQPNTLYYYRYIVAYGSVNDWNSDIYTFTTASDEINLPVLTTVQVTGVATTSATCLCNVVDDGGAEVYERGACWSTNPNPDITSFVYANGGGLGEYSVRMNLLEANTTYYVRAYAKNSKGIGYGNEIVFTTMEIMDPPMGCLSGVFSVSEGRQVWFSQGNLMYNASTHHWGFAESQYEFVGADNANIGENYSGWIDLFGWGTSGFDHGAVCWQPWSTAPESESYFAYGSPDYNLFDQDGSADWGYGVIVEKVDNTHPWRTLTDEEWDYLLNLRNTPSGIRFVKARVDGVNGLLLLPDYWSDAAYLLNNINQDFASYSSNVISLGYFYDCLEANGAIFLPAAGYRNGTDVVEVGTIGRYWAATGLGPRNSWGVEIRNNYISLSSLCRPYGHSVRLVYDVERR